MFLHLCVILFTGGSQSRGVSVQGEGGLGPVGGDLCPGEGGLCPWVSVQGRGSLSRWSLSRGSLSRGSLFLGSLSRGSLSRRVSFWGVSVWGSLSRGSLSRGSLSSDGLCPGRPPRTVKSGWYTCYWNAFLYFTNILCHLNFCDLIWGSVLQTRALHFCKTELAVTNGYNYNIRQVVQCSGITLTVGSNHYLKDGPVKKKW